MTPAEQLERVVAEFETLLLTVQGLRPRWHAAKGNVKVPGARGISQPVPLFPPGEPYNRASVDDTFDALERRLEEAYFVQLVAQFESLLFQKLDNAVGEVRRIVKHHYRTGVMHRAAERLVKDRGELDSLGKLTELLKPVLGQTLAGQLKQVIDQRNYLAHGGRFGVMGTLTLPDAMQILREVIEAV